VIITLAETGGAGTFVRSLAEGLREEYSIEVAAHGPGGPLAEACALLGIPFHHLENLIRQVSPRQDVLALREIRRLVEWSRPDIVQINSSKAGVLARLALAGSGIPAIFTAHGWAFAGRAGFSGLFLAAVERTMAPLSAGIVCVSEWDRSLALARRIASPDRLHVIRNGIAAPDAPQERGAWPARPLLICVTRLRIPQKDVALLLEALSHPGLGSWRLRIIGDGPERPSLVARRDALGLGDRVEILGERRDVAEQLASADAFVLPSRWEGLPYSILEAMRAGLPVVASRVGGVPELVVHETTGLLVQPGSVSQMASALRRLHDDGAVARSFGRAGYLRVQQCFTREAMLARYDTLFRSMLGSSNDVVRR